MEKNLDFKVQGLAAVRVSAKDIRASKTFYENFFNLKPEEENKIFISFRLGQTTLEIVIGDEKSPASLGGGVGYWQVTDLDAALIHAKQLGAIIYRGPLKIDETKETIVQIAEPGGTIIGLKAKL